ncbi:hypothetical protein ACRAWG_36750 [Methylobacterium sp. P31]
MNIVLDTIVYGAVRIADALDDLLAEAALGFGAAAPFVSDRGDNCAAVQACSSRPDETAGRP